MNWRLALCFTFVGLAAGVLIVTNGPASGARPFDGFGAGMSNPLSLDAARAHASACLQDIRCIADEGRRAQRDALLQELGQ